jgi:hypothetical protein
MADLLNDNTDFEVSKYYDAQEMNDAGFDPAIIKDKKSVFNPESGMNDILTSMPSGGYVKIGEEEPEVMAEAPAQPEMPSMSDAAPAQAAAEYAQQLQEMQGSYTLDDLRAAGYTDEQISTAGLDIQPTMPESRTEALSEQEVADIIASGQPIITADPTLRDEGSRIVSNYFFNLAAAGLIEELREQGMGEAEIERTMQARENELLRNAEVYSNALFGTGATGYEVGVGDFLTAGTMDIQEGYRMFQQQRGEGGTMGGRAIGMAIMAAGVAEATGVGYAFGKLLKSGAKAMQPALVRMGEEAQGRIDAEGATLFSNPVGPIVDRGLAAAGRLVAPKLEDGLPGRISTRLPTAKAATEDPMTGELIVGLEEMKTEPALYEFNVNITKDYPNMQAVEGESVDETAERFIEHVKDNLLYIHDKVPADTRVRSQKWYDGARAITDRWSEEYGVPDTSIAGALAALSPQKDWYQNVSLAQRVLDVAVKQRDFVFANEMEQTFRALPSLNKPKYEPMLEAIKGKSYAEVVDEDPAVQATLRALFVRLYDQTYNKPDYQIVGPEGDMLDFATTASGARKKAAWGSLNEIGKAVASIDVNGDVNTISRLMGERHKVRNFYNNIYDPNSPFGDVTIDTHAVAAGLLRPLSGNSLEVDHNFKNMSVKGRGTTKGSAKSGVSGNYGLYAEAYRRAAVERGILPRQMQSITWEAVRGLFTDKFKQSAKNVADIDAIWQRYKDGEIDLDETRRLVDERAGGINPPSWE